MLFFDTVQARKPVEATFSTTRDAVQPFEPADLLADLGALSLVPANAPRLLRLEALANVVAAASDGASGKPSASKGRLNVLCNSGVLAQDAEPREDPFDNCLVESASFFGGSYLVFPGIVSQASYTFARIAHAVFNRIDAAWPPQDYGKKIHDAFRALLIVSDTVLSRARLTRASEAPSPTDRSVVIPASDALKPLKAAVTFNVTELSELLETDGLSLEALEPFISRDGAANLKTNWEEGPLTARPLFRAGEQVVCGVPGLILSALRHHAITLAKEFDVLPELAKYFSLISWIRVNENLERLRHRSLALSLAVDAPMDCRQEGFFSFDTDKIAFVQLVTDHLTDYNSNDVFGSWKAPDIAAQLLERARSAETYAYSLEDGAPNEVLHIMLFDSPGRMMMAGFPANHGLTSRLLTLTAYDLDSIAHVEHRDPLVLWQFAEATDRLRQSTNVVSFGQLDEFEVWRKRRSFYMDDGGRPDLISIQPGSGVATLREVHRRFDRHGVISPDLTGTAEVVKLEEGDIPVYGTRHQLEERINFLVEGLPQPVWIQGPNGVAQEYRSAYWQIAEMLAYWVWQLTPHLRSPLQTISSPAVVISIGIDNVATWVGPSQDVLKELPSSGPVASYQLKPARIALTVHRRFLREAYGADNTGERQIMEVILRATSELARQQGSGSFVSWTSQEIANMVEEIAPLGLKKKLLILNTAISPELDPIGIPPYRPVQQANEDILLDELGEFLSKVKGIANGPILDDSRTAILRDVVEYFYQRLQEQVSTLRREGLLDWLIAHNEAIVRESAYRRLTTPTRIQCYGRQAEVMERLQKETPELNTASLTARFLIEYVAARPPDGRRRMSLSVYDELMALASEIVSWATQSDLIHFQIADLKVHMLRSGRLGMDREDYLKRRDRFYSDYLSSDVEKAFINFPRTWRARPSASNEAPDELLEVDAAFQAEMSFTLTEIVSFLAEVMNLGTESRRAEKHMAYDVFIERLSSVLGWHNDRTQSAAELFMLTPREDFLKPPAGFRKEDVYPWGFNRLLSLMRRPLIWTVTPEGPVIHWGNRQVSASSAYLFETFWTGRLKASSQQMKVAISKIRAADTGAFAHEVAQSFLGIPNILVKEKFKKVKGRVLGYPDNLGDVDVLVADTQRHRLLLIEAKDLGQARTPFEISCEIQELVVGSKDHVSMIDRHIRRADWIRANVSDVLETLELPTGKWTTEAVLVVDEDLMTPYLTEGTKLPVISLRRLKSEFLP